MCKFNKSKVLNERRRVEVETQSPKPGVTTRPLSRSESSCAPGTAKLVRDARWKEHRCRREFTCLPRRKFRSVWCVVKFGEMKINIGLLRVGLLFCGFLTGEFFILSWVISNLMSCKLYFLFLYVMWCYCRRVIIW